MRTEVVSINKQRLCYVVIFCFLFSTVLPASMYIAKAFVAEVELLYVQLGWIQSIADTAALEFDAQGGRSSEQTAEQILGVVVGGAVQHNKLHPELELVVSERRGDKVVLLTPRDRQVEQLKGVAPNAYSLKRQEISLSEHKAGEAIVRALDNESGWTVAPGYKGHTVLAAFMPLEIAGHRFGLVAKSRMMPIAVRIMGMIVLLLVLISAMSSFTIWLLMKNVLKTVSVVTD